MTFGPSQIYVDDNHIIIRWTFYPDESRRLFVLNIIVSLFSKYTTRCGFELTYNGK